MMNIFFRTICISMICIFATSTMVHATFKQDLKQFTKRFSQWKKTLSADQLQYHQNLFATYQDLLKNYKKEPKILSNQEVLSDMIAALDNIMNNWTSFYKQHVDFQMFHQLFVEWQESLTPVQQQSMQSVIQNYTTAYEQYDKTPNAQTSSQLFAQMSQLPLLQ